MEIFENLRVVSLPLGEDCVSSQGISNNGVRYVAEQPSLDDPNLRRIICNELFPSDNKQVMIHRDELRDQRPPGSGKMMLIMFYNE